MNALPHALLLLLAAAAAARGTPFPAAGLGNVPFDSPVVGAPTRVLNGSVPAWLDAGTLYRNGPARFPKGNASHFFDGLAMVHAFRFSAGGAVSYSRRYVHSTLYNESDPCAARFRGQTSEFSPNTDVVMRRVGEALLTGTGYLGSNQVDPRTLETLAAPFPMEGGVAQGEAPSHGCTDPRDGTFVHYAARFPGQVSGEPAGYELFRVPGGTRRREVFARLAPRPEVGVPLYAHSFSLTERFVVLPEQPCTYGRNGVWSDFKWIPELPVVWHVVERATGREAATLVTRKPFFYFHTINAYETADGASVVVDLVAYPNNTVLDTLYVGEMLAHPQRMAAAGLQGLPTRFVLPLGAANGTEVVGTPLSPLNLELPRVNPLVATREYRYSYGIHLLSASSGYYDALAKVDAAGAGTRVWSAPNLYPSEPIFVPRPGASAEDDGVVLSVVLDEATRASFLLVLDGASFREVARVGVDELVPFGFHGAYYGDL